MGCVQRISMVLVVRHDNEDNFITTTTVAVQDCTVDMAQKEASNPDDIIGCESSMTLNPPRAFQYRVTSLPLDSYSEAAKRRVQTQEMWKMHLDKAMLSSHHEPAAVSGWWGCCWLGWMGFV